MKPALLLCCLLLAPATRAAAQDAAPPEESAPQDLQRGAFEETRDRIMTSLMYRGKVADMIMESGRAAEFVSYEGEVTHADVRLALIEWIGKNPGKAARLALDLKSGTKYASVPSSFTVSSWKVSDGFMAKVRALTAAAKSGGVSAEEMELAAHRLFAGSAVGAGNIEVDLRGGRGAAAESVLARGNTDFRLNRAGLDKELAAASSLLDSMRGGGAGPAGAEKAYAAAVKRYGDFVVAASALKGRDKITAAESAALEERRALLQTAVTALAVRVRAADARIITARLERAKDRPGGAGLLAAAEELRASLERDAAAVEAGDLPRREQWSLARRVEEAFAAFYLKYSVYSGLLGLKLGAGEPGYSCLFDYLLSLWLEKFCPQAGYVKARAALKAAAAGLDDGLLKAGAGDLEGALSGPGGDPAVLEAAAAAVAAGSASNRAAQYFLWGAVFRPVELRVEVRGGRPVFRPEFALYGVLGRGPASPISK